MYRVLLVDDEPLITEGLRALIPWESQGFEIAGTPEDGIEALAALRESRVDILITDVRMPRMDGLELIKRARVLYPDLRIIVLSGYDDFRYVKACVPYRIQNYLLKPVNAEEFLSTLQATVNDLERDHSYRSAQVEELQTLREHVFNRWLNQTISHRELADRLALTGSELGRGKWRLGVLFRMGETTPPGVTPLAGRILADARILWFQDMENRVVFLMKENEMIDESFLGRIICDIRDCEAEDETSGIYGFLYTDEPRDFSVLHEAYPRLIDASLVMYGLESVRKESFGILSIEELDAIHLSSAWPDPPSEVTIRKLFSDGDRAAYEAELRAYLDEKLLVAEQNSQTTGQLSAQAIRFGAMEFTLSLVRASGLDESLLDRLMECPSVGMYRKFFDAIIDSAWVCAQGKTDSMHPSIRAVLVEVHGNTGGDLSLKHLSDMLSLNPTYLGQLFRQETGKGYTEYVTEYRVKKAADILANTTAKASEIAETVGFLDPNYFYRIFRKYFHCSPTEYRRNRAG